MHSLSYDVVTGLKIAFYREIALLGMLRALAEMHGREYSEDIEAEQLGLTTAALILRTVRRCFGEST
jgi:hypothetical protein